MTKFKKGVLNSLYLSDMEERQDNSFKKTTRVKNVSQTLSELGRVPPHSVDIEQAILGAMMFGKDAVNSVIDKLKPVAFYDPKHVFIFSAITDLFNNSKPIDIITVTQRLKEKGELEAAGGISYITQLTNRVGSSAHIEYHAAILLEKAIKRELIRIGSEIIRRSFDDGIDVFESLNDAQMDLYNIMQNNLGNQIGEMKSIITEAVREIEIAGLNKDGLSGIGTGFHKLDKLTAGWQRSDFIVIAARPAMGKTAFILSMARNTAVDYGHGVAIFSLEMSSVQLVKRLISSESKIPAEKLRKGNLADHEFQQLHSRITRLAEAPIYIDDTPGISVTNLRTKSRRLKDRHNIQLIIIDYLQLMTAGGTKGVGNREQEISTISRSLKEIAKELNVPVIALSQLSRSVESRGGDKRPMLSDLRESGAIEQDADIVSFIYRPEYYKITHNENNESNLGIGEIIIAKHRNGGLDTVRLKFINEYARFENPDNNDYDFLNGPGNLSVQQEENQQVVKIQSRLNNNDAVNDFSNFDFNNNETYEDEF